MQEIQRPVANPVVVLREEFDDWAVLFNPDTASAVGINPVGVAVWKLLDGHNDLAGIMVEIGKKFARVPEAAPEQVARFIANLVSRGFVGYEVNQ